jgi:hypothetical protein
MSPQPHLFTADYSDGADVQNPIRAIRVIRG